MKINSEIKQRIVQRFNAIEQEGMQWVAAWKDLSRYEHPTRGKFDDKPNKGQMIDHQLVLDSHATQAIRVLSSGMQSGMTSPARPWFKLAVKDDYLNNLPEVRMWLDDVTKKMLEICSSSNVYSVFQSMYEEIATFGTASSIFLEDYDTIIRGRSFTIGEYYLGANEKGMIDTFGRKFQMQVGPMVKMFGKENCSPQVQNLFDQKKVDQWITVYYLIQPNEYQQSDKVDNHNMPFSAVYWENNSTDSVLTMTGFEEFPLLSPRWDTVTTDQIYGYGPGWNALGNVKQLQKTTQDKLLAQEKSHNPPMQKDSSVEGYVDLLPGGVTAVNSVIPNSGVRPAYQVNTNLDSFLELISSLRQEIDKDFFVNLFLMIIDAGDKEMTATEVAERQQEKMMMMGPVLERLTTEMLDPFIERLYSIMERNMLLPPAPEVMQGVKIEVDYISILAQAQKAIGVNTISRIIGMIGAVTPYKQDVADVIDLDGALREAALLEGLPSKLVVADSVVRQIRDNRAKAEQIRNNIQAAGDMAKAAKDAANAKLQDPSVLKSLQESYSK